MDSTIKSEKELLSTGYLTNEIPNRSKDSYYQLVNQIPKEQQSTPIWNRSINQDRFYHNDDPQNICEKMNCNCAFDVCSDPNICATFDCHCIDHGAKSSFLKKLIVSYTLLKLIRLQKMMMRIQRFYRKHQRT